MSLEAVLIAFDVAPPSIRSGVPEPKGCAMGSRAEVAAVLEAEFGPLDFGSNNTGGIGGIDPEGESLLVNLDHNNPCFWVSLSWRGGFYDMDERLARIRQTRPDWYIYHPILGEWDHHLSLR